VPGPTLLFGATSILGFNLAISNDHAVIPYIPSHARKKFMNSVAPGANWQSLNLEDPVWIRQQLDDHQPQTLIYCHAVCDVTKCEQNPNWAYEINVRHVERLMKVLPDSVRLIYISSDHVFSGDSPTGGYDESSTPCPITVYGQSRAEAEAVLAHRDNTLIIRAGLALGPSPQGRTGHRDWLRYRLDKKLPITIIRDEARSVYWAKDLVTRVMALTASQETGLAHIPANRAVSRPELANYLVRTWGKPGETPSFKLETRAEQSTPHLGCVELTTIRQGELFSPLPAVVDVEVLPM
jgi:dTDP-4-dehydrorhamnose reductase